MQLIKYRFVSGSAAAAAGGGGGGEGGREGGRGGLLCFLLYIATHMLTSVRIRHEWHVCQLTLVRLIAIVGETVVSAVNQTQLASETGRAARQSWHWLANVRVPDSEGVARLLRGTAGMAADTMRHDEDQARKRRQQNEVPHCPTVGLSLWEGGKETAKSRKAKEIQYPKIS